MLGIPYYKVGDVVDFIYNKTAYTGKIVIVNRYWDMNPKYSSYDIELHNGDWIKDVPEFDISDCN